MPASLPSDYPFRNPQHLLQAALSHADEIHAILQGLWTNTPPLLRSKSPLHRIAAQIPPNQESAAQLLHRLHIASAQQIQALLQDEEEVQATDETEPDIVDEEGSEYGSEAMDRRSVARSNTKKSAKSNMRIKSKNKSKIRPGEEYDDNDASKYERGQDTKEYCFCHSVSYGDMVGCENDECPYEWFHVKCVGLKEIPSKSAVWYCPECTTKPGMAMKAK